MKLCIFGLTITSSWGSSHALHWRGLVRELARLGHHVVFFERDDPAFARHRDTLEPDGCELRLYRSWDEIRATAATALAGAEVGMVTSLCPDARAACDLVLESSTYVKAFYEKDAAGTFARIDNGERIDSLPPEGLASFDVVLSFIGGDAMTRLRDQLGARRVAALHASVDTEIHRPDAPLPAYAGHASYLGAYAPDRRVKLDDLFLEPSRRLPDRTFVLGGACYPEGLPLPRNVVRVDHVPAARRAAFYSSSRLAVSVTSDASVRIGYCPSRRLFEAAACGVPVLSDSWPGLDRFFEPGREIFAASNTEEAIEIMSLPATDLARVGRAARERATSQHTARHRAVELVSILADVATSD